MGEPAADLLEWLRPEFQERQDELIHLARAAEIAGVTRASVSNWHRRHESFRKMIVARHRDGGMRRMVYLPEAEFRAWHADRPVRAERTPGGSGNTLPTRIEDMQLAAEKARHYREGLEQRTAKAEAALLACRAKLARARELERAKTDALDAELEAARRLLDLAPAAA